MKCYRCGHWPCDCRDGITIIHGDCRDILPQLDPVDHVITDPPYEAEAHTMARRQSRGPETLVEDYCIDFSPIDEATRRLVSEESTRLATGWLLMFCQAEAISLWRAELERAGARWVRAQAWIKPDGTPQFTGDRPSQGWEAIATAWASPGRMKWNGGGKRGFYIHNVNSFGRLTNGRPHPTQKPLTLMTELVSLFTDPGETILDPLMGSGTTLRAAKDLGRKAIGIEIEERYCEIAAKRLAQEVLSL